MSVDTDTFEEVVTGETWDLQCDVKDCEAPATWALRLLTCCHVGLHCDPCHERLAEALRSARLVRHLPCQTTNSKWRWEPL